MKYGLDDKDLELLVDVFKTFSAIERVRIYGSRAKGTNKPFSDVDITLDGDTITHDDLIDLSQKIDDLLLPYQFDISIFKNLKNTHLVDHINRRGIAIYSKSN